MKKLLLLLLLLLPAQSWAISRYFDSGLGSTCGGSNNTYDPATHLCTGGSGAGYKTLIEAHNAALAGETVLMVTNFTCPGSGTCFTWTKSGTAGSPITFTSYSSRKRFSGGVFTDKLFYVNGASNLTISNIEFRAGDGAGHAAYNKAFYASGTTNLTVTGCLAYESGFEAVRLAGANSNFLITQNSITSAGLFGGNGECLYIADTSATSTLENNGTISQNDISGCNSGGIDVKAAGRYVTIEKNHIHDININHSTGSGGIEMGQLSSGFPAGGGRMIIRRNRIHDIRNGGAAADSNGMQIWRDADIYENIVDSVGGEGININTTNTSYIAVKINIHHNTINNLGLDAQGTQGITIGSNVVAGRYACENNAVDNPDTECAGGSNGNVNTSTTDPLWVDGNNANHALRDFHLTSSSPLIGGGVTNNGSDYQYSETDYTVDYDGVAYLSPKAVGAFERNTGTPATITLVTPNGGGVYKTGTNLLIAWKLAAWGSHNVDISLSADGGSSYFSIATNQTFNANSGTFNGVAYDGSYTYSLIAPSSTNTKIKVVDHSDSSINDASDAVFRVNGRYLR